MNVNAHKLVRERSKRDRAGKRGGKNHVHLTRIEFVSNIAFKQIDMEIKLTLHHINSSYGSIERRREHEVSKRRLGTETQN